MFSNYGELKSAVQAAFKDRSDIPAYVYALATAEINNRLRTRDMETTATLTTTAGVATVALPSGFLMLREAYLDADPRAVLRVVDGWTLQARHVETGRPREIAVTGDTLTLNPTPDAALDVVVRYIGSLAGFSLDTDTNDVLTRFPALYLYSALHHVAIWAQDMEMAAVYLSSFEREIDRVRKMDRAERFPSPLSRSPQAVR